MASKLLLVIIPAVIVGIFGLATTMLGTNQGGESGDTNSVIGSEDTIIITGDENQVIINQYSAELQEIKQNLSLLLEKQGIEPQIDPTQKKEIPPETLQEIDILYRSEAKQIGINNFMRVPVPNDTPEFAKGAAQFLYQYLR